MLFVVQRDDCTHMTLAKDLDPHYATRFSAALSAGVEVLVYDCTRQIYPPRSVTNMIVMRLRLVAL